MKICIDKNHLVVIENEDIPQVKEYVHELGGSVFSAFDKEILLVHKKDITRVHWKNIGEGMNVIYIKNTTGGMINFELDACEDAFKIFTSFNEDTGEKYFFVPKAQQKEMSEKNTILQKIDSKAILKKTEKGVVVELKNSETSNDNQAFTVSSVLSFFFGLVVLYGKFESKTHAKDGARNELVSCKIQLPLFGHYLNIQEKIDAMISFLRQKEIFLKVDKLQTSNGIIYQISCTDYEVLELFAKWYEGVEKFERITKRDFTQEMKTKLLEFIKNDNQIPEEGKLEVMGQIEKGMVKLLVK